MGLGVARPVVLKCPCCCRRSFVLHALAPSHRVSAFCDSFWLFFCLLLPLLLLLMCHLRSVVLLKGDDTLASFLELEESKKAKADGEGGKGDSWWDGEPVAEAAV